MLNLKLVGASLLLGASTIAIAQQAGPDTGANVSAEARTQPGAPEKAGLVVAQTPGADAAAVGLARAAEARANAGGDDEDENEDDTEVQNQGVGTVVSGVATTTPGGPAKGGLVVAATPAADKAQTGLNTAADARAAGVAAAANARAAASANRADVTQIRAQAAAARADARAAASQARQIRDTVRAARPGRGN